MRILWQLLAGLLQFGGEFLDDWNRGLPETRRLAQSYDFIIVGGGSAGCVLANRLSENPNWRVLLIEAGSDPNLTMDVPLAAPLLQLTTANWNYTAEPSNTSCLAMIERRCRMPRGKVLGGSSVLNYMIFTRGNRRDYDRWAQLGNPAWSYDRVLPYFKKLETFTTAERVDAAGTRGDVEFRGLHGPLSVSYAAARTRLADALLQAHLQHGLPPVDYNGARQTGTSYPQVTEKDGRRHSAATAYLQPIRARSNLHLMKHATVQRVLLADGKRTTARGVLVKRAGELHAIASTKEVILSAGAIGSPHLLMLSGIGPWEHLTSLGVRVVRDLPVGRNLMDHIAAGLTFRFNGSLPYSIDIARALRAIPAYLVQRKGLLSIPGGCELIAFYDSAAPTDPDGHPDIELAYLSTQLSTEHMLTNALGVHPKHHSEYEPTQGIEGITVLPMILRPKSRGYLQLRDADPDTPPLIVANYLTHPDDVRTMVRAIKLAMKIMHHASLRKELNLRFHKVLRTECPYSLKGRDKEKYFECLARYYTITIYHQSGTCKMGPRDDATSVVDERGRVHGIAGLRVADASIMPEIVAGHTHGPVVMIAERISDLIKEDHGFQGGEQH